MFDKGRLDTLKQKQRPIDKERDREIKQMTDKQKLKDIERERDENEKVELSMEKE